MPITKHHRKKYPNSEWVRRRNIRRAAARQALKQDSSVMPVATVASKPSTDAVHSPPPTNKPKSWWEGIKNAFVGRARNTKSAA